ncbi:MAG: DUF4440 domain-containing protein [Alphaproteobacteria bacterium]|nr:DUF4440 domain-containing protein [Alphaproteobacteria bacterium]
MIDKRTEETLQDLEKRLHRREIRGSRTAVSELLADDFTEIGRSGRVYDKAQLLSALASETSVLTVETAEFGCREIAKDVVLLTYVSRTTDDAGTRSTLRSSLWKKNGDRWQMVFHQGTPTDVPWIETA